MYTYIKVSIVFIKMTCRLLYISMSHPVLVFEFFQYARQKTKLTDESAVYKTCFSHVAC